jgi:Peptidase family M50
VPIKLRNSGNASIKSLAMSVYVIICGVRKKELYLVGRTLATLVSFARTCLPLLAYDGVPGARNGLLALSYVVLSLATMVAVVVHELGHLVACKALGAKVKAFRLGGNRAVRFRAGAVEVSLGLPYSGRVEYTGTLSVWRRTVITLAGSLADLALGGLLLGGWAAAASGPGTPPLVVIAAGGLIAVSLINLMPFRTRSGRITDGARLFEPRCDVDSARLLTAGQTAARLRTAGRATELLDLHAGLSVPDGRLSPVQAACLALVELHVIILPGRLPDDATQLADRRLSALTRQQDLGAAAPAAYLALALLRLRQGETQGAEAERLSERALAGEGLDDRTRALAFAAVIMSRQVRGLPYADVRARAAATLKPGKHSPEVVAVAAALRAAFDPEAALRAFLDGDSDARLGVGDLAKLLLRQGRTAELLELHTGFAQPPAGPDALAQTRSLHEVEYHVLLVPDLPLNVLDEAAHRVQWAAAKHLLKDLEDPVDRAGLKHSVAVARLRQGRFAEVEEWCAPALAGTIALPYSRRSSWPAARSASRTPTCSPRPSPCPRTPIWSRRPGGVSLRWRVSRNRSG